MSKLSRYGIPPVDATTKSAAASLMPSNIDDARREEFKRDMIAWHERFRSELGYDQPRQYVITHGIRK